MIHPCWQWGPSRLNFPCSFASVTRCCVTTRCLLVCHFPSPVYHFLVIAECHMHTRPDVMFAMALSHPVPLYYCLIDTSYYLSILNFPLGLSNALFSILNTLSYQHLYYNDICLSFFCEPSSSLTGSRHQVK